MESWFPFLQFLHFIRHFGLLIYIFPPEIFSCSEFLFFRLFKITTLEKSPNHLPNHLIGGKVAQRLGQLLGRSLAGNLADLQYHWPSGRRGRRRGLLARRRGPAATSALALAALRSTAAVLVLLASAAAAATSATGALRAAGTTGTTGTTGAAGAARTAGAAGAAPGSVAAAVSALSVAVAAVDVELGRPEEGQREAEAVDWGRLRARLAAARERQQQLDQEQRGERGQTGAAHPLREGPHCFVCGWPSAGPLQLRTSANSWQLLFQLWSTWRASAALPNLRIVTPIQWSESDPEVNQLQGTANNLLWPGNELSCECVFSAAK